MPGPCLPKQKSKNKKRKQKSKNKKIKKKQNKKKTKKHTQITCKQLKQHKHIYDHSAILFTCPFHLFYTHSHDFVWSRVTVATVYPPVNQCPLLLIRIAMRKRTTLRKLALECMWISGFDTTYYRVCAMYWKAHQNRLTNKMHVYNVKKQITKHTNNKLTKESKNGLCVCVAFKVICIAFKQNKNKKKKIKENKKKRKWNHSQNTQRHWLTLWCFASQHSHMFQTV